MNRSNALAVVLALFALACIEVPDPCDSGFSSREVTSQSYSESGVLSEAGDALEIPFTATLRGLPELWRESPIAAAELRVLVTEQYTTGEPGGDGLTEMPRLVSSFSDRRPEIPRSSQYTSFPGPAPQEQLAPLFPSCELDPDGPCCKRDSTSCTVSGTLFVTRIDGTPFPPVDVSIETRAHARLLLCPIGNPEIELTREAP